MTDKPGSWALLTLSKNVSEKLPSRDRMTVDGVINCVPFQASLEPDGKGSHRLQFDNAMHIAAGAEPGVTLTVEITRAGAETETRVPAELRKALTAFPAAQALWEDITPIARRDWIFWIITAKQPDTRRRRIENACNMLASGKRRVCCFGGIKWLIKTHATSTAK